MILKGVAAGLSGSLSVISSLVDSVMDLVSGIIIWLTSSAMKKRLPYHYPSGIEYVSSLKINTSDAWRLTVRSRINDILHSKFLNWTLALWLVKSLNFLGPLTFQLFWRGLCLACLCTLIIWSREIFRSYHWLSMAGNYKMVHYRIFILHWIYSMFLIILFVYHLSYQVELDWSL